MGHLFACRAVEALQRDLRGPGTPASSMRCWQQLLARQAAQLQQRKDLQCKLTACTPAVVGLLATCCCHVQHTQRPAADTCWRASSPARTRYVVCTGVVACYTYIHAYGACRSDHNRCAVGRSVGASRRSATPRQGWGARACRRPECVPARSQHRACALLPCVHALMYACARRCHDTGPMEARRNAAPSV